MVKMMEMKIEDAPFFLGENINSNFSKDIWNVDISICNNEFKFYVDTGADINILNYESYFKIMSKLNLKASTIQYN